MKIAVGSHNPLKLSAVKSVLERIREGDEFIPVDAQSGVSHTPLSNSETIAGARRRAEEARKIAGADWGVGLEGGMNRVGTDWFTCVWCVIFDGRRATAGGGVHFQLPPAVVRSIVEEGKEMGPAMDELAGTIMSKQKMGAEGLLTAGLIDRTTTFEIAAIYALAPRLSPEYYPHAAD
ncbi:MAG: inosine/xanthosine triphosphatase [Candidatus Erginobacter occultus]|nr:inosine/xanthosine triphosphatase [Candidatus Erginobacter occultus]